MKTQASPPPFASSDSPPPDEDPIEFRRESMLAEFQMWMAPFPPPRAVAEYERVLPGTWDRLLRMAEEAQAADIATIKDKEEYVHRQFRRGQIFLRVHRRPQ